MCKLKNVDNNASKENIIRTKKQIIKSLSIVAGIMAVFLIVYCLHPFERELEVELVATVYVDAKLVHGEQLQEEWHAVYEKYGLYAGTWVHPHEYYQSLSNSEWPEMDLENYTYIITYSQKIKSLTYNNWDIINVPTQTGAKAGHMVLCEEIDPLAIYIYRIPKMRINNSKI